MESSGGETLIAAGIWSLICGAAEKKARLRNMQEELARGAK